MSAPPATTAAPETWTPCAASLPDSDTTVLIANPAWDDPVWIGYHDGTIWRSTDNLRLVPQPTHWRDFPAPPEG